MDYKPDYNFMTVKTLAFYKNSGDVSGDNPLQLSDIQRNRVDDALSYALERDLTTYSLIIPLWPFYLILMFGFLLMAFIALLQLVEDIASFARKEYLEAEYKATTDV